MIETMNKVEFLLGKVDRVFASLPDRIIKYRLFIWSLVAVCSIVVVSGADDIQIDMSRDAYYQRDDPFKIAYDRYKAKFGSDDILYIVYQPKDNDVFSDQSLRVLKKLQDELLNASRKSAEQKAGYLNYITEVKTLINAFYMEATDLDLVSRQFIGEQIPKSPAVRESLRQQALDYPDYPLRYLSRDSRYGGIMIHTNLGASIEEDIFIPDAAEGPIDLDERTPKFNAVEMDDYIGLMNGVQAIIARPEFSDYFTFHAVGKPPTYKYNRDVTSRELVLVIVLCLLLIVTVLAFLFRSLAGMLWPVCIVMLSLAWVLGLIGWLGVTITALIEVTAFMVLAVGIANAIHILSGYRLFRQQGENHRAALRRVYEKSGLACLLASLTTAIGLLALSAVPIAPIKVFGLFTTIGVLLSFIFSMLLLPLMLDIWSPYAERPPRCHSDTTPGIQVFLQKVEHLGYRYPYGVIIVFSLCILLSVYGITRLKIDTDFIKSLPESSQIRRDVGIVDTHMGGGQSFVILVDAGEQDAFQDPRLLQQMEALQNYALDTYPDKITLADSIVNVTKQIHQMLNDNQPAMYKLPETRLLLQQTLFIFNGTNARERRRLVTDDYSSGKIGLTLKHHGSRTYLPVIEDIQRQADALFQPLTATYPQLDVTITGRLSLDLQLVDYISWSQIKSFGLTLFMISLILPGVFGSIKIGLTAVLPNLFPTLVAFGVMGLLALPLDCNTLIVAPIIISVAVDDTIHFLIHYRLNLYQTGDIAKAIQQSVRQAGQAICFTSITLIIGSVVFLFTSNKNLQNYGLINSVGIGAALLADILLLPALCVVFKAGFRQCQPASLQEANTSWTNS